MKKFLTILLTAILTLSTFSFIGCKEEGSELNMYVPDGAPALSVARLLADDTIIPDLKINVVSANVISTFVTGEDLKADLAIMPVNAASKMLGNANNYQMLGVVTNGNLFLMKKGAGDNITVDNLSTLIGKKVGVINLANVPGLTFKAILADNDIPFANLNESGAISSDKVNLVGLSGGGEVIPSSDCDYFVVPEPAATTKENATKGALKIVGSLQTLYGGEGGYPQAVLVAKKSVIESNKNQIDEIINSFAENKNFLTSEDTKMEDIVSAVQSGFIDKDTAPTFNANNLNAKVIENCAISFTSAINSKQKVLDYIAKLNAITSNAWGTPTDSFFYLG